MVKSTTQSGITSFLFLLQETSSNRMNEVIKKYLIFDIVAIPDHSGIKLILARDK
jgi:hypothetical protein